MLQRMWRKKGNDGGSRKGAALTMRLLSACLELIYSGSLAELTDRFSQVIESLLAILVAVAALGVILAGAVVRDLLNLE